ncbi:IS66 family transposase [Pseudomonas grimontii]
MKYAEADYLPIDNNAADRSIRPLVIGRNNSQFSDTLKGAMVRAKLRQRRPRRTTRHCCSGRY